MECFLCALDSMVHAIFILFAAFFASMLAIHKYQSEQRTSRLQKIYFEDTLLGQAKSIEEMKSQTIKNILVIENLYHLILNLIDRQAHSDMEKNLHIMRNDIIISFDNALKNIEKPSFELTDFKKETISKILYDSNENSSQLSLWIDKFQRDVFRFSFLIDNQIFMLKPDIYKISESNLEEFKIHCRKLLHNNILENYLLVKRHDVLFHLFSNLVLEFSSENYTNIEEIFSSFKKEKIKTILSSINQAYKDLITDFDEVDIGRISPEEVIQLRERIDMLL